MDMPVKSRETITSELYELSLEDLLRRYIDSEYFFLIESDINEKTWIETLDTIEVAETRLWQIELLNEWIPMYRNLAPQELLANKVLRYENYIKRAETLHNPSIEMMRTLMRFRTFLYILGHKN